MIELLKKLKSETLLILSTAVLSSFFYVSTALNTTPATDSKQHISEKSSFDFPLNDCEKISDNKYALQRIYNSNPILRQNSARRSFNPVPSALRTNDLSSLPLSKHIIIAEKSNLQKEERSYLQKYFKYSLPRRAGPVQV